MKLKMTKVIALIMCMALLAGCGGGGGGGGTATTGDKEPSYNFRVSSHYPDGHSALDALDRAKERIFKESDGRITLQIFPNSQLGDYTLAYEELMKGSLDMAFISMPSIFDQRFEMNYIPYMFVNYDEMAKCYSKGHYFFETYSKLHADLGVKFLGFYAEGFMVLGLRSLPAKYGDPLAKKSEVIRTPQMNVFLYAIEDMGFPTVAIPYADLYTALQTGVCDGWIGGTAILNYTGFRDVIKYVIPVNTTTETNGFLMSESVFSKLSDKDKKIIEDAFMDESIRSCKDADSLNAQAFKDLEAYGVEVVELSDSEMRAYADHVRKNTWPKLEELIGKDLMTGLLASVK